MKASAKTWEGYAVSSCPVIVMVVKKAVRERAKECMPGCMRSVARFLAGAELLAGVGMRKCRGEKNPPNRE